MYMLSREPYAKNEKEDLSAAEKKSALASSSEMLDGQE